MKHDASGVATWVVAAAAGDRQAFRRLVERYSAYATAIAYGITGDFDSARDVSQEAFVAAYRSLSGLRDADAFAGWFGAIVRNKALMQARSRDREGAMLQRLADRHDAARPEPAGDSPDRLEDALRSLEPELRETLALRHLENIGVDEIARRLGLSRDGVKSRLSRAREKLRENLERQERGSTGARATRPRREGP